MSSADVLFHCIPEKANGKDTSGDKSSEASAPAVKMPKIMPASMWTRKDLVEFKDKCRKTNDSLLKISSLSSSTVSHFAWHKRTRSSIVSFDNYCGQIISQALIGV
jgi:hypothetical protein